MGEPQVAQMPARVDECPHLERFRQGTDGMTDASLEDISGSRDSSEMCDPNLFAPNSTVDQSERVTNVGNTKSSRRAEHPI